MMQLANLTSGGQKTLGKYSLRKENVSQNILANKKLKEERYGQLDFTVKILYISTGWG